MGKKITREEFIKIASNIHKNKYDYSKVEYVNSTTKVCIVCPEHGEFYMKPNNHINQAQSCPKCRGFNRTTDEWIKMARMKHENKYDYSKSEYKGSHDRICIICPEHGEFWQVAREHLKYGCIKCGWKSMIKKQSLSNELFIEKAQKIHKYKYDYSKTNYVGYDNGVCIICPEHGEFWTTPHTHLDGHDCPTCAVKALFLENKLYESIVSNFVNLTISKQFKAKWLKYKHKMSIDIFIDKYNIGIEYQGIQHFKHVGYYGDIDVFKKQEYRDELKNKLCGENGITLLYFSYHDKPPENYKYKVYNDETELFLKINEIIKTHE